MAQPEETGTPRAGRKASLQDFRAARNLEVAGVKLLRRLPADGSFGELYQRGAPFAHFYALVEGAGTEDEHRRAIEGALTLLWLFKPGAVWVRAYDDPDGRSGFGLSYPMQPKAGGPYELSEDECDRLEAFASYFEGRRGGLTAANVRYLGRALELFGTAIDRRRPEQRLADLVIALEGLLVERGDNLKYKLAVRTALLIGRTDEERLRVFGDMKRAYDLRSAYVHGEEVREDRIGTLPDDVRRYFTNAVVRFLDLPQHSPEGVGEKDRSRRYLDEQALRREVRAPGASYPGWWRP
jgi:hypothetical protein